MATRKTKTSKSALTKADPTLPALKLVGSKLYIRGGTTVAGERFSRDAGIRLPDLVAGTDYGIAFGDGGFRIEPLVAAPKNFFAGFHFAPGGNAPKYAGGNSAPSINPFSLWDVKRRPNCPDPRGMAFIAPRNCWADIYLTGADHLMNGTSKCGVTIADGNDPPQNPMGGRFPKFDYATAIAVMKHHGKTLLSIEDVFEALIGVTERTACGSDPRITQLDAPRTSKYCLMQATGNMLIWCHDGHPIDPRASIAGGSWVRGVGAGSRCANVGVWAGYSYDSVGARGRGDHLQLG